MPKSSAYIALGAISLDPTSKKPLYRQLYEKIREAILTRQLIAGLRLPPTRTLAHELEVSRNTVINAFEQLIAEGYLESRVGAGTYVTQALPEDILQVRAGHNQERIGEPLSAPDTAQTTLSERGLTITTTPVSATWRDSSPRPFRPGVPALDAFPFKLWGRMMNRCWRNLPPNSFSYGESAGYRPLREAIAVYLGAARGVRCEADQIIIVAGAQHAIHLAARLLLDSGDPVWIEDPGYLGARGALLGTGAEIYPIPVDDNGFNVGLAIESCPQARMVYITPSHQYPLGVTMSLARRLALLEWARNANAWILEDDYDSEYRYAGRPLAALQGLDQTNRVIYIGTFSKVLFPALRLGYLVVPPNLVDAFMTATALVSRCPPLFDQVVLADFINEGYFARHIRQMRNLYAERQSILVDTVQNELDGILTVQPTETGLHLVGWLAQGIDDNLASARLAARHIEAPSLSSYAMVPSRQNGLVLGYAAVSPGKMRAGIRQMKKILGEFV